MRGCLQEVKPKRKPRPGTPKTWNIILALGRVNGKHKQKWVRFHGTKKQAEQRLTELVGEVNNGEFVEPSKLTVGQYLDEWLKTSVKPRRAANTYDLYTSTVENHLKKAFGDVPLQKLSPLHVERYYAESKLSPATLAVHHALLTTALKAAVLKGILRTNAASRVANKPRVISRGDTLDNVWTAAEAQHFLTTVKTSASDQDAALFALALDTGARRGELLGLQWRDLEDNKLRIERQLSRPTGDEPGFTPPKCGGVRTVELSDETVVLLQAHKRKQAELKMANRQSYRDHGLIFAQGWEHKSSKNSVLGDPLNAPSVNSRLRALCKAADVRQVKPHGLRHTSATLLLSAGVPPHVVQRRLGHKKVEITLNLYAHVLPSMQADAASRLATLLHG